MFENAKVGDRVWSLVSGWGTIISLDGLVKFPIVVRFDGGNQENFNYHGYDGYDNPQPVLYWNECKISQIVKRHISGKVYGCKYIDSFVRELRIRIISDRDIAEGSILDITYSTEE